MTATCDWAGAVLPLDNAHALVLLLGAYRSCEEWADDAMQANSARLQTLRASALSSDCPETA